MLPRIAPELSIEPCYREYVAALKQSAFSGDIRTDYAARLAVATDNSVYQVIPSVVLLPKTSHDIVTAVLLCQQGVFTSIKLAARGGGTGTNGQSLSAGVIIDCSQYMREILELNLREGWVRVQPGVVLDQLNTVLKPHGVHFAPEISPSNRATLGGMINTDACGNGSGRLGRTSDHVLSLTCVLSNGDVINTEQLNESHLLYQQVRDILAPHYAEIQKKCTPRPRNLNGYNLYKSLQCATLDSLLTFGLHKPMHIDFNYLLCGSEGTLGIVSECKLKLSPIPKHKKVVLIKYRNFDDALRSHVMLNSIKPLVVEAIDEKLVELARQDPIYFRIKDMLDGDVTSGAVNIVEFVAETSLEIDHAIEALSHEIRENKVALGCYVAKNETEASLLWELRKKSVGLISKSQQKTRRPIPFIEDTAVPPEKLADYIHEFKLILNKYELIYGMYGHVDAGCVHVRPALDLKLQHDEQLFSALSNEVASLVDKYGGVMWGEHGIGFRSQYAEQFFGQALYHVVRQIKTLFDPDNRFNPGKIATSLVGKESLVDLMGPLRAKMDKQIVGDIPDGYQSAMDCNGNGACFNYVTQEVMCPSYKVTKDRVHSPKGRATLIREWLRLSTLYHYKSLFSLKTNSNNDSSKIGRFVDCILQFMIKGLHALLRLPIRVNEWIKGNKNIDFSDEVYSAMQGCLACKACVSQCPLSVDVPQLKSTFLNQYHQRYFRSVRDYVLGYVETIARIQARFSVISNALMNNTGMKWLMRHVFQLVDMPFMSPRQVTKSLLDKATRFNVIKSLAGLTQQQKLNTVLILQDTFTSLYDAELVVKVSELLSCLGINVIMLPLFPNGKPLHAQGFLEAFQRVARSNREYLAEIAKFNIPIVGIEPSMTLVYRDEYQKLLGHESLGFTVHLLQEWLAKQCDRIKKITFLTQTEVYYLLTHCTEKSACVAAEKQWQEIFAACGISLLPLVSGCCGMAGSYGHEVEHKTLSQELFMMDWGRYIHEKPVGTILATGYSCRSQVKRFSHLRPQHPIEVLLSCISK